MPDACLGEQNATAQLDTARAFFDAKMRAYSLIALQIVIKVQLCHLIGLLHLSLLLTYPGAAKRHPAHLFRKREHLSTCPSRILIPGKSMLGRRRLIYSTVHQLISLPR